MVIFLAVGNNSSPRGIQPTEMGREPCDQAVREIRLQIRGVLIAVESLSVSFFLGTSSTDHSESDKSLMVVFPIHHGLSVESLPGGGDEGL